MKGYKRKGKRLIPPILQAIGDKMVETSYINDVIPNIIWASILCQKHGIKDGAYIAARFLEIIYELIREEKFKNYAMLSVFYQLTPEQIEAVIVNQNSSPYFKAAIDSFKILNRFFPASPMNFLGANPDEAPKIDDLNLLRKAVGSIMNKYGRESVVAQATVMYARDGWGTAGYAEHIPPPNLNHIFADEDSEEFARISGWVRISALTEFMPDADGILKRWPQIFWHEAFYLDECISDAED
jgi:hypothetical protein